MDAKKIINDMLGISSKVDAFIQKYLHQFSSQGFINFNELKEDVKQIKIEELQTIFTFYSPNGKKFFLGDATNLEEIK